MLRGLALALALSFALALTQGAPAVAQGCPADAHAQIAAARAGAEHRETGLGPLNRLATDLAQACPGNRALAGHLLALFAAASLATEPPERFAAQRNGLKSVGGVLKAGGDAFVPVDFGESQSFGPAEEQDAYFDLMLSISTDFLVFAEHEALYTPGTLERFGCGLYPAEEAAALALQGEGNADGGELVARVGFLGRQCDLGSGAVAGQAARYFAAHAAASADPGYLGLTQNDIRQGLRRFLDDHLAGSGPKGLFSPDEIALLRAF